jgi:hypothetical protein
MPMEASSHAEGGRLAPLLPPGRPTVCEVEHQLARLPLVIPPVLDPRAEAAALPSMAEVFADGCYHARGYPPSQEAFVSAFAQVCAQVRPDLLATGTWRGVAARLQRAYPSFVREVHLALLLTELGLDCWRDVVGDQLRGIDILVVRGPFAVGISTFVSTSRARALRAAKLRRRPPHGLHVEAPLDLLTARPIGAFRLYGPADAQAIAARIEEVVRRLLQTGTRAASLVNGPPATGANSAA